MLTANTSFSQSNKSIEKYARKYMSKNEHRKYNWDQILPINNDSILLGWQINPSIEEPSDTTKSFIVVEALNRHPSMISHITIYYKQSATPGQKLFQATRLINNNLITNTSFSLSLKSSYTPRTKLERDSAVKGISTRPLSKDSLPAALIVSPIVLKEPSLPSGFRHHIISAFYLGMPLSAKQDPNRPITQTMREQPGIILTPSLVYILPAGKHGLPSKVAVLDIQKLEDR
jgi:hypothetical protein